MDRTEFLSELRKALSCLPEYERYLAIKYYEEYLDEAGPEKESEAIKELGDPVKVAEQVLNDYKELYTPPVYPSYAHTAPQQEPPAYQNKQKKQRNPVNPVLFLLLILFALPIGLPVLAVMAAVIIAFWVAVLIPLAVIAAIPVCFVIGGIALIVCSLFVLYSPASALVTLGSGLGLLGAGVLSALFLIKICTLFVPPIFRGFVNILRWPFVKLGII